MRTLISFSATLNVYLEKYFTAFGDLLTQFTSAEPDLKATALSAEKYQKVVFEMLGSFKVFQNSKAYDKFTEDPKNKDFVDAFSLLKLSFKLFQDNLGQAKQIIADKSNVSIFTDIFFVMIDASNRIQPYIDEV